METKDRNEEREIEGDAEVLTDTSEGDRRTTLLRRGRVVVEELWPGTERRRSAKLRSGWKERTRGGTRLGDHVRRILGCSLHGVEVYVDASETSLESRSPGEKGEEGSSSQLASLSEIVHSFSLNSPLEVIQHRPSEVRVNRNLVDHHRVPKSGELTLEVLHSRRVVWPREKRERSDRATSVHSYR